MQVVHKMLSSRGGTVALGGAAALMAAFVLLLYLNQYRNSVTAESEPVTVLVAKKLIEKGMPGDIVGARRLFESEDAPRTHVRPGAITDPSTLRGRVAASDIYPGQQLTVSDFTLTTTGAIGATLSGRQRAIALPLDSARGLIGKTEAGDRVDVFASLEPEGRRESSVVKVIVQNALVLDAPRGGVAGVGANQTANVVLRVNRDEAATMAYAVDNGKVWIVLRPRAGTPRTKPGVVTDTTLLADIKPSKVYDALRKQNQQRSGS
jgi:Flp pilus assembly protein CpaB